MKRYILHIIASFAALMVTNVAWGITTLGTSGSWNGGTLENNITVKLTGAVTIKGQITIPNGKTLTIQLADSHASGVSGSTKHIQILASSTDGFARMFLVEKGGKLVIKGRDAYTRIVLDGGARFTATTESNNTTRPFYISGKTVTLKTHNTSGGKDVTQEAIRSTCGTLTLDWVTIENVWDQNVNTTDGNDSGYGGAIYIYGANYDGTKCLTTITNCIIQNCCDEQGSAIMLRTNNEANDDNPDSYAANSKVTIKNTTIQYCFSSGSAAGTIRTNGRTVNSLELDNVTIRYNYSYTSGGGIYWNACGSGGTRLTLKNCNVYGNVARSHGGGLHVATNVDFSGTNNIYNNHSLSASGQGGGIRLFSYTGTTMPKEADGLYNFTYNLPEGLNVYNNTAAYGAGIAYNVANFRLYSGWDDENHKNVKINVTLNLNGANVHDNTATLDGAGIWLANNTDDYADNHKQAKINIKVNFNQGTIDKNISSRNGAGVYLKKADITHVAANAGTLAITNNIAPSNQNGGGIYIESGDATGKTIDLTNVTTTISGNQAQNGAGIYLNGLNGVSVSLGETTITNNSANNNGGALFVNGGDITMKKTTITSNTAKKNGGAIFLQQGNFTTTATTSITNNNAVTSGGAIYVTDGKVKLNSPTISGNGKSGSTAVTGIGGAIYVTGNFEAVGTAIIENNASINEGGAIYVNGGAVSLQACTINGNKSKTGGAIFVTGTGSGFTANGSATIANNEAVLDGGALYVNGGNIELAKNTISNNSAVNGGALYVNGGSITMNGDSEMSLNKATNHGGVAYVNKGSVSTKKTKFTGNEAENGSGGAFYILGEGTTKGNLYLDGTTEMRDNSVGISGGVFYVENGSITTTSTGEMIGNSAASDGGVFYVKSGDITLGNKTTMENNTASNGGAIALAGGVFSIHPESEIKSNSATNGGGLWVENNNSATINCLGGSFIGNTATGNGGALYAKGNFTFNFDANVRDNVAQNGGGLYIDGSVNMNFGQSGSLLGLIVGNFAKAPVQTVSDESAVAGTGGGIYLNGGTLSFSNPTSLGVYNNAADYQAADIYASGSNTTINLPYVKDMNLSGFDVPGSELYWVEDFYGKRYQDALLNMNTDIEAMIVVFTAEEETNKKKVITDETCLDLGYDLVFVTFKSTGLQNVDNAELKILYPKEINDEGTIRIENTLYRTILFSGENDVIVGLPSGNWKFEVGNLPYRYKEPTFVPAYATSDSDNGEKKGYILFKRKLDTPLEQLVEFAVKTDDLKVYKVKSYDMKVTNKMIPQQGGSVKITKPETTIL